MSAWKEHQMGLMPEEEWQNVCAEENARERYLAEWDAEIEEEEQNESDHDGSGSGCTPDH